MSEIGLSRKERAEAQLLARIPDAEFEEVKKKGQVLNPAQVMQFKGLQRPAYFPEVGAPRVRCFGPARAMEEVGRMNKT